MSRRNSRTAKQERRGAREARFERHARLATARAGDDRYPHRTANPDGTATVTGPDPHGAVEAALRAAGARFRAKFGREMGPGDPLLFDEDADEPRAMTPEQLSAQMRRAAAGIADPEARAHLLAYAETGYLVTEANQHTFTAHEVETYLDAVAAHL